MPKHDLDAIDCRIVAALQADGRLSNTDLAERVGLSASPCLRRVKRLERDGYIDAYRAVLQRERIGLGFSVFVGVKIEGHANDQALTFEKAVLAMPEVVAFHLVSGEVDYFPISSTIGSFSSPSCSNFPSSARCEATLRSRR